MQRIQGLILLGIMFFNSSVMADSSMNQSQIKEQFVNLKHFVETASEAEWSDRLDHMAQVVEEKSLELANHIRQFDNALGRELILNKANDLLDSASENGFPYVLGSFFVGWVFLDSVDAGIVFAIFASILDGAEASEI